MPNRGAISTFSLTLAKELNFHGLSEGSLPAILSDVSIV